MYFQSTRGLMLGFLVLLPSATVFGQESSLSKANNFVSKVPPLLIREGPLAEVTRELYMPYPEQGQSHVISNMYLSPRGLRRLQVRTTQIHDDVYQDAESRFSDDNGRTWSDFHRDPERDITFESGYAREPYIFSPIYDPTTDRMIRLTMLRTHKGDPRIDGYKQLWDHSLWQISENEGHTWNSPSLLKYEEGADYSITEQGNEEYLEHNRSYTGYNLLRLNEGGFATACTIRTEITNEQGAKETVGGVVLFVGKWDATQKNYQWQASNPVAVSRSISDRGLFEGWVSQLSNGNLFVDMRANRTHANSGRSFYAISKDGGKTLSKAMELKYDDETRFFRSSSLAKMFRHSITKKLYWFGNIIAFPDLSDGSRPRFPLYLVEVDEEKPALKRETLTVIDDYDPKTQTASIQYSNFSIIEDRETHAFELYLTGWGEYEDGHQANVYKYTIKLK